MKKLTLIVLSVWSLSLAAQEISDTVAILDREHTARTGMDSVPAEFFRKWYHRSDLIYYLEALNDHTIVQTSTYGQWSEPERMTFAVEGMPHTANRFYIDGMRVDDRFQAGSTVYVPNMQQYNMLINTHTSQLYFMHDSLASDYVQVSYNFGQLGSGEPMPGTKEIFNITHRSPMESADAYKHVSARRHYAGAGKLDAAYTLHDKQGNDYRQHLYVSYGQRLITREDQNGLITDDPFYNAQFYKVQADGYLPMKPNEAFTKLGYRLNFSGREDGGSEYLYNYNEVYDLKNYSGTLYAKRDYLTTGLTWNTNVVKHNDLSFSKNIIDQDGQSFEPWVADGKTHELSWAVNYEQPLLSWLSVHVDAYNSLIHFSPDQTDWTSSVYLQPTTLVNEPVAEKTDLYRYEWHSNAFTGGLLENTVGLKAHYKVNKNLDINGHLDLTVDGMLLSQKTKVSPNIQAGFNLDVHPCKWFEMGLTLSYERMPYNMEYMRYMSNDYMNAEIYHAGTNELYATTGGKYHNYGKNLRQTTYFEFDLPIRFVFGNEGRHEIVLQQSYKKFFNVWHTYYRDPVSEMGHYELEHEVDEAGNTTYAYDVFYQNNGEKYYEVGATPEVNSGKWGFIKSSPFYFSQLARYTYTGKKVTVSIGWQSLEVASYSGLGNGANTNTMGVLSESTANPNNSTIITNPGSPAPAFGRVDLDKGFVCRFYLGYNICKWVQAGATIKWTDGNPISAFQYYYKNDQVAVLPRDTRGTNPIDLNFGSRHCAKYMLDLHLQGHWMAGKVPMTLNVECYNLWDFCLDLCEMSFVQDVPSASRSSMVMDIPIGLLATLKIDLLK